MSVASYLLGALGLAVLMVVHEGGHYVAARRFGMRVIRFSIGLGPTLWRHQPKGSPTVYQVAIIPFLAYVQIAGMNPYEENDEDDPGSYANASLWARIVTIAAGPLANYLFASLLFFVGYMASGRPVADEHSMRVRVVSLSGPAHEADLRDGDKILTVDGDGIHDWDQLRHAISSHPGEAIDVAIERDHATTHLTMTPGAKGTKFAGKIGVIPEIKMVKVTVREAALLSITAPPKIVAELVVGLARTLAGKEKPELSGPVGIVKQAAGAVRSGAGDAFQFLGQLSAYLGGFNLLPIPALDGGRLLFLAFEATSRKKADAKVEAKVHAVGLLMMLTLIAVVTWTEIVPR